LDVPSVTFAGEVQFGILLIEHHADDRGLAHLERGISECTTLLAKSPYRYEARYKRALAELAFGRIDNAVSDWSWAFQACPAEGVLREFGRDLSMVSRIRERREMVAEFATRCGLQGAIVRGFAATA